MSPAEIKQYLKSKDVSQWELAEALNVHENTVYRMLRMELPMDKEKQIIKAIDSVSLSKHPGGTLDIPTSEYSRNEAIWKLRSYGITYEIIAKACGITIQRVRQIVAKEERKLQFNSNYKGGTDK